MLHKRLKMIRNLREISQKEMATFMRVTLRAYQRYERGEQKPSYEKLVFLLDELKDINPNWLLTGEGPMWRDEQGASEQGAGADIQHLNPRSEKVLKMFEMLDEDGKDDVLKYIEKIKQIKEMQNEIRELKKLVKAG